MKKSLHNLASLYVKEEMPEVARDRHKNIVEGIDQKIKRLKDTRKEKAYTFLDSEYSTGVLGGAAVGGLIGNRIGKRLDDKKRSIAKRELSEHDSKVKHWGPILYEQQSRLLTQDPSPQRRASINNIQAQFHHMKGRYKYLNGRTKTNRRKIVGTVIGTGLGTLAGAATEFYLNKKNKK